MGIFAAVGILLLMFIYDRIDIKLCERRYKKFQEELKRSGLIKEDTNKCK